MTLILLRTNIPYQLMEFPDFHQDDLFNNTIPFPTQPHMLKFLQAYANNFDLDKHIKLNHVVIRVLPIEDGKWEVIVRDLVNEEIITEVFDAVIVANGHFFAPNIPEIDGTDVFKGKIIHSHDYRTPEAFRGRFFFNLDDCFHCCDSLKCKDYL